jgi:soluble lytic murein transglycosylase-like protein
LWDSYTNLWLSACYFKELLAANDHSIVLGLVAYNAGPYSKALEAAKRGGNMNPETANYVPKITRIKEKGERND